MYQHSMAVEDETENRKYKNTGGLQRDFPSLQLLVLQGPLEAKVPPLHLTLLEGFFLHEAVQLFLGSHNFMLWEEPPLF